MARLAGVSPTVVSYVVNHGPRPVAEQTANRVREAMDLLGYSPNASARALRRGTTETLGLVLADTLNPFFTEYTYHLVRAAAAHGKKLIIADSGGDAQVEQGAIMDLIARQVDGLLLAGMMTGGDPMAALSGDGVPLVLIDCPGPMEGRRTVGAAAEAGARRLVDHLITVHGRRRIGLVVGDQGFGSPDPRERGWQNAIVAAGQEKGPVARVPFSREGGYAGGLALLAAEPRPDAIFATSDMQAVGLLRAIREQGLRIPGDVAVVSFDGTAESEYCWPPLTVARQPLVAMAAAAITLTGELPEPSAGQHVEFDTELVIRRSCGCDYGPGSGISPIPGPEPANF